MKKTTRLVLAAALLVTGAAHAGTKALGFELGVTTVDQLRSSIGGQTQVTDAGENSYSAGPMLKTDGSGYGIQGLSSVLYIFDPDKKLAGILMNMDKHRFNAIFQMLAGKYRVTAQERPFVGNKFARFKTEDSIIEVDAPHLSFDMEVTYLRNDLMQKFTAASAAEAAAKKRQESAQF